MHLPRLHPEDLAELSKSIAEELKTELRSLHAREDTILENTIFSVHETAEMLKKDPDTIYRWCRSGIIKATKSGREWMITKQSLQEHIAGNMKKEL